MIIRDGKLDVTSKDIDGISDLVVWAPIKEGFINAFDNVTYESRLRLVSEALHSLRKNAREFEKIEPFADTAKRILSLLNFRIGVVDRDLRGPDQAKGDDARVYRPRKYMYLVATFNGAWEPYMRLIYQPLGTFLDLVLTNCEGYKEALNHSFSDYARWVRDNQLDSAIFYSTSGLTVGDTIYMEELERIQRSKTPEVAALEIAKLSFYDPDTEAKKVREEFEPESLSLGLEALNVLYKLTSLYPPTTKDGEFLTEATHQLLDGLADILPPKETLIEKQPNLKLPLEWFLRSRPQPGRKCPDRPFDRSEIQKGIFPDPKQSKFEANYGALVMLRIDCPEKFKSFLKLPIVTWNNESLTSGSILANISFTYSGLEELGLKRDELAAFPKEFRQGMAERAPLIGDKFGHHPRSWVLPERNWPAPDPKSAPVEIAEIDCLVQVRAIHDDKVTDWLSKLADPCNDFGFSVLSVQRMARKERGHFGFEDGISQPNFRAAESETDESGNKSMVALPSDDPLASYDGDLIYGYPNSLGDDFFDFDEDSVLFNGTYLVVRKIEQNVEAFKKIERELEDRDRFKGNSDLLMGRTKSGLPLISGFKESNTFDYSEDPDGKECPFSAHIRLANPRDEFLGRRSPKILRKGMSYGPLDPQEKGERGIMFMAYCSNIAEQYEIVQRWLNGGNPSNVSSTRSDPITAPKDRKEDNGNVFTFWKPSESDPSKGIVESIPIETPLTTLRWGAYFFVPSKKALAKLSELPATDDAAKLRIEQGQRVINETETLPADVQKLEWKKLVEDFLTKEPTEHNITPKIWEAIDQNGGIHIVETGIAFDDAEFDVGSKRVDKKTNSNVRAVLVTDEELIKEVFAEGNSKTFSSKEQLRRIKKSIGAFYVCRDEGRTYEQEATVTNNAILSLSGDDAIKEGYISGRKILADLPIPEGKDTAKIDLAREYIQPAIGELCRYWFGIPDTKEAFFKRASWIWDSVPNEPHCPGHFLASSRQAFYPRPTDQIQRYGIEHGLKLEEAGSRFVEEIWDNPDSLKETGNITKIVLEHLKSQARPSVKARKNLLMRNIIGIMIGAIPPMEANLRWVLFDWLDQERLWRIQSDLLKQTDGADEDLYTRANNIVEPAKISLTRPLETGMSIRPAPDLIFRTVQEDTTLGGEDLKKDDLVVLCLSAATQARLRKDDPDVTIVFGGDRRSKDGSLHACAGKDLAMGGMTGILAALLDYGTIRALPANLIVELQPKRPCP